MPQKECTWVDMPSGKYPVYVAHDLFTQVHLFEPLVSNKKVFVLSHPSIANYYYPLLEKTCLQAKASHCSLFCIESGESQKSLETATSIWSKLLQEGYHRHDVIIALGGGMIGDLAGFSAACYLRGIDFIQCPTTLLSQIDAAIGGKTAVNLPQGKNLIGTFYQPKAVFCDLTTLKTLAQREYISGCAELLKYGLSLDAPFFEWCEAHKTALINREKNALEYAVQKAIALKSKIVSQDERDNALRRLLNFGHTVAHALESLLDYKQMLHGEAVAIGMVAAVMLSVENNACNYSLLERLIFLLNELGLPTKIPNNIKSVEILMKMKHDKKQFNKGLQWVLLNALGDATISETITTLQVEKILQRCGAQA